jgi:glutaconate CoA-transferase subunit B
MRDVMACVARGMVDYCFLGGAQIDPYGNINSTMIGKDFHHPKVRMPGSGGANDLASHAWRSLVVTIHDKRRFVEKMDFVTSPGYLDGPGARERVGLPKDTGPYKVITDLAVMGFDPDTCRMRIESIHPGVTVEQVKENTGFEIGVAADLQRTEPPTDEELRLLRDEVDPMRYVIGR